VDDEACRLIEGDCLDVMGGIPDGSIDLIAADPPYGTTVCRWDVVIPFEPMWGHIHRILKPRGAVVLTASQPFTSMMVMSNPGWFRCRWVWDKVNRITGFLDVKKRPLRVAEDVLVFSSGQSTYNPQMTPGKPYKTCHGKPTGIYAAHAGFVAEYGPWRYPTDILRISADRRAKEGRRHPTQKPVALFEYLIRTYSNEGETVLDFCMGSGTTGVACLNTGRRFIGIESDPDHFCIASDRISAARAATPLFA
jgi:hypothetical protein